MELYFFALWIREHGNKKYEKLMNKITSTISRPPDIVKKEEAAFFIHYFYIAYMVSVLNYFGMNENQICYFMDSFIGAQLCSEIKPKEILASEKDIVQEMQKYIKEDIKQYEQV